MKTTGRLVNVASLSLEINLLLEFILSNFYIALSIAPLSYILLTTITKGVLAIWVILLLSSIKGTIEWIKDPGKKDILFVTILGALAGIITEIYTIKSEIIMYGTSMPTIFGASIFSLFQIPIAIVLAIWLMKTISRDSKYL